MEREVSFGGGYLDAYNARVNSLSQVHYWIYVLAPTLQTIMIVVWLRILWPLRKPPKSQDAPDLSDLLMGIERLYRKGNSVVVVKSFTNSEGKHFEEGTQGFVVEDKDSNRQLQGTANVLIRFKGEHGDALVQKREGRNLDLADQDLSHIVGAKSEASYLQNVASAKVMGAGEAAGDYSAPWYETFDLHFLLMMIALLIVNGLISWAEPFTNDFTGFLKQQLPKWAIMMAVSCLGGMIARHYCHTDADGYCITNPDSWFKVNYTRKLQHFAAYVIPLVMPTAEAGERTPTQKMVVTSWAYWFTLLGFLVLIKPIREAPVIGKIFMLQFNALDRPEDRPQTLEWIILGNILPGLLCILLFIWLYSYFQLSDGLTLIFVLVDAFGDGLAEPVGVYLGRHKYRTVACGSDKKYTRSLEGSACLWVATLVFLFLYPHAFPNMWAYWTAFIVMPPVFTFGEAYAPHTMDTPTLMGGGGLCLLAIALIFDPSKLGY